MTTQMVVRIDSEMKKRLGKLARMEGKTSSQMVRDLIESYIKDRDIGPYIDSLWNKIDRRLEELGVTQRDVDRAIKAVRKEK
ncbi:MAG: CopG family transcriptional regulator [Chloroflexi bacterium]|nr:CopG family transcriptional regulator [Chloroflexota bacterium]